MLALSAVAGAALSSPEVVKLCQKAEHEYVGTRCGIMDQFAVSFAAEGNVLLLDCRSLGYRLLPVPRNLRFVVCNSMVRRELASGEYNLRRADCETGVRLLQAHLPAVSALRDVEAGDLERYKSASPEQVYRRCRHVVTEHQRTLKAVAALQAADAEQFGQLMYQSHASLREDCEVSCKELDLLVALASALRGVLGARMTGGGFGGCTINLVEQTEAAAFAEALGARYAEQTGIVPQIHVCHASGGAHRLE